MKSGIYGETLNTFMRYEAILLTGKFIFLLIEKPISKSHLLGFQIQALKNYSKNAYIPEK